jgi:hypothetical protein
VWLRCISGLGHGTCHTIGEQVDLHVLNLFGVVINQRQPHGDHNANRACELLKVSRSTYYAERVGRPSLREHRDVELTGKIIAIHDESDLTYGSLGSTTNSSRKGSGVHANGSAADAGRRRRGRIPKRWKKTPRNDQI